MWKNITKNSYNLYWSIPGILLLFTLNIQKKSSGENDVMLFKINEVRSNGCYCGRKWMEAAPALVWNDTLFKSAESYARHLKKNNTFSHISADGKDIGKRLDEFNYPWQYVGENLGEGQSDFDEVLGDWLKSRTHCRMLMNPLMKEVAVANYKGFWVQHFGTKLPTGAKRTNVVKN